jgi:hypothetical protein
MAGLGCITVGTVSARLGSGRRMGIERDTVTSTGARACYYRCRFLLATAFMRDNNVLRDLSHCHHLGLEAGSDHTSRDCHTI